MNIIIDEDVLSVLKSRRKNVLTIDYGILSSCWSIMPEIFIRLKNPSDSNKFEKYTKNNLDIYINKDLSLKDEVRIKFPKYISDLSDKEFEASGISLPS